MRPTSAASAVIWALFSLGVQRSVPPALDLYPRIESHVSPVVDFSRLRRYAWHPDQRLIAEKENHLLIVLNVQRTLGALGYDIDTQEPDLRVLYDFEIRSVEVTKEQVRDAEAWQWTTDDPQREIDPDYDPEDEALAALALGMILALATTDERTVDKLELTLTLFDTETNWLAYRATGTFPWSEDEAEWILRRAVRKLLEPLPKR
jgi:hypothetical protein